MTHDNDGSAHTIPGSSSSNISHIRIALQQNEQAGQPMYANVTSLNPGQDVVIVNFGFIDSQTIQALQHTIKSGENPPTHITAHMSCRVALNSHATHQLAQQLEQLLNPAVATHAALDQKISAQQLQEQPLNNVSSDKPAEASSSSKGFRFPWSKK